MRAVEAVLKVSPDGSAVVNTEKPLRPGLHKIMIITDEAAILEGNQPRKEKKHLLDLKSIHVEGWPRNSTLRREDIYDDDGR